MIEETILSNLLLNKNFNEKVFPYIKKEYFDDKANKVIFETIHEYEMEYNEPPSLEALRIKIESLNNLNERSYSDIKSKIDNLKIEENTNLDWLVKETEKFCQDRDLYNAVRRSILIMEGEDKTLEKGSIPSILQESLGVSFDSKVGHDYLGDIEERYEYYHRREKRLEFDIDLMNKITKGGLTPKTLTLYLAMTGVGKSLVMCHNAATNLMHGKNVIYVTMELPEEEIARRIDANLMDITVDEVGEMPLDTFKKRIGRIKEKTPGKLFVKEYPTGYPTVAHFRHMVRELAQKENFVPDVIYIDYLNICSSSRIRGANAANSYTLVKSIAEEIRGLAMELNIPIVSASQLNRGANDNSDPDLSNISESSGTGHTADVILALITNEQLEESGKVLIKQLKNRLGDLNYYRRFAVGINRAKMKLYDLEDNAQDEIMSTTLKDNSKDDNMGGFTKKVGLGKKKVGLAKGKEFT